MVIGATLAIGGQNTSSDLGPRYYTRKDILLPSAPDGVRFAVLLTSPPATIPSAARPCPLRKQGRYRVSIMMSHAGAKPFVAAYVSKMKPFCAVKLT